MSLLSSSAAVLLATSAVAVAIGVLPTRVDAQSAQVGAAAEGTASRPFKFRASDEALADLKRRIKATRWPSRELVADDSQGVRLATMQKLADYWANQYDWRKVEERLSALPQFVTTIDGVDIHFIHVKSKDSNALPVIITHGWPGSIIEQIKIIEPLTNPTAHGGSATDAFDVVIPSIPGYGFSGKPTELGWDPQRIARAWATLMDRLGYKRYVAQGGDWGDAISEQMALQKPTGLLGIHTNMPGTLPDNISAAAGRRAGAHGSLGRRAMYAWDQLDFFYKHRVGYAQEMGARPQTLSTPWRIPRSASPHGCSTMIRPARSSSDASSTGIGGLTRDDILDNITLYWLTETAVSSGRLFWESKLASSLPRALPSRPVAVTAFPDEIYTAPRSWP